MYDVIFFLIHAPYQKETGVHSRCLTFCYAEYDRCVSDSYEDIVCDDIDQYCLSTCLYFYNQVSILLHKHKAMEHQAMEHQAMEHKAMEY